MALDVTNQPTGIGIIENLFQWTQEECEQLADWNEKPNPVCTCEDLQNWYSCVFAWQPLQWYLNVLKFSGYLDESCKEIFDEECELRRFSFDGLNENIYNVECTGQCNPLLKQSVNTCNDIEQYKNYYGNNMTTWFDDGIPFAGLQTCTFVDESEFRPWDCLTKGAKVSLIVILIYLILVVIFSAVSNLTILIIYSSRRHLRHALGYHWRISLAISDLVSGLIVTPGAILNIYMRYFYVRDTYNAGPVGLNEFGLDHTWVTTYLEVFGFFTTVAVTSEIYALMFHSIERFICVKYPFYKHTQKISTRTLTKLAIGLTWILAVGVATIMHYFPVGGWANDKSKVRLEALEFSCNYYTLFGCNLVTIQDESLILMVVLLLIPAIIISVVNVLLYCSVADSQKSLRRASAAVLTTHADLQLAKTLIVMVTSFILAVIPMIVMCILGVIWDDVYITYPESYNPAKANMYNSFTLLSVLIAKLNAIMNVCIYISRHEEFRNEARALYTCSRDELKMKLMTRRMATVTPRIKSESKVIEAKVFNYTNSIKTKNEVTL